MMSKKVETKTTVKVKRVKEVIATTFEEKERNRAMLKILVRNREDFQDMRKRNDNRMGVKADGDAQEVDFTTRSMIDIADSEKLVKISEAARAQEAEIEKDLTKVLKRFPIYNDYLLHVKGVGTMAAAWIIGEFDIHKATTVSKLWQFAGMNPGLVRGKKRKERKDGGFDIITTDTLVRGDKKTAGFVAPFNGNLRTALLGVMASGFIKCQNAYCMEYYYPYKARLEQSANEVEEVRKAGAKPEKIAWSEAKKAHRDRAAQRYMVKMFLADLYNVWRAMEGLEVRPPYQEEKLGHKHVG